MSANVRYRTDEDSAKSQRLVLRSSTHKTMRTGVRHSTYRGLPITVRWTEIARGGTSWGPTGHQFVGSYLIAAAGAESDTWQHCSMRVFLSLHGAAAHALAEAQRQIDENLEQRAA